MTTIADAMYNPDKVVKCGWLIREVTMEGSMATWRKQWNTVTLHELCSYKTPKSTEPLSRVSVASIEEMSHGTIDDLKSFAFELRTPRGEVRLAADTEAVRKEWLDCLRELVPLAKKALALAMIREKSISATNLELTKQQIKEAIEQILRDSKKAEVRGGFKAYADQLAMSVQGFLQQLELVSQLAHNSAKDCSFAIANIVDNANSAAAVSTNKKTQNGMVMLTRDICVETVEGVLNYMIDAAHNASALQQMRVGIGEVREMVQELLLLLKAAGDLEQQLDNAKRAIERRLEEPPAIDPTRMQSSMQANVDGLMETAKLMQANIRTVQNNVLAQPERVGVYSQQASELMCEMLEATNIVSCQGGVDPVTLELMAGIQDLPLQQRMQLESMLAAAKGFAAATTNMIDVLREVPNQTQEENVQLRVGESTRSADNALNAFMKVVGDVDTDPRTSKQASEAAFETEAMEVADHTETELLASLASIDGAVDQISRHPGMAKESARPGETPTTVLGAARSMGEASAGVIRAVQAAQQELVASGEFTEIYRKDPNWSKALAVASQSVAENTAQLMTVASDENSTAEQIVAAARCVNGACKKLQSISHVHGSADSAGYKGVDAAQKTSNQAMNQLVNLAKQLTAMMEGADEDFASLRSQEKSEQIRAEYEAQREIARLEAECEAAREYLQDVRNAINEASQAHEKASTTFTKAPSQQGGLLAPRGGGGGGGGGRGRSPDALQRPSVDRGRGGIRRGSVDRGRGGVRRGSVDRGRGAPVRGRGGPERARGAAGAVPAGARRGSVDRGAPRRGSVDGGAARRGSVDRGRGAPAAARGGAPAQRARGAPAAARGAPRGRAAPRGGTPPQ